MSTTQELVERLLTAPGPLSTEDRRAAAARLDELERENARLRNLLSKLANRPTTVPVDAVGLAILCRAALAGSGEK